MTIQAGPDPAAPTFELRHRLARSLEWAGLSSEDMADALGVHVQTIRNYLKARHAPSRGNLTLWAFRCGVPPAWLIDGENSDGPDTGPGQDIRPTTCRGGTPGHGLTLVAA